MEESRTLLLLYSITVLRMCS